MARASVKDVALFFIALAQDAGEQLTHMKLQKLLYYAQSWHLGMFGEPLFDSPISAWKYGPVCSQIYHEYKQYGNNDIPFTDDCDAEEGCSSVIESRLPVEVVSFLHSIAGDYMRHSAITLSYMTHKEKPWIDAVKDKSVISYRSMQEYYGELVLDDDELTEIEEGRLAIQSGEGLEWKPGMFI